MHCINAIYICKTLSFLFNADFISVMHNNLSASFILHAMKLAKKHYVLVQLSSNPFEAAFDNKQITIMKIQIKSVSVKTKIESSAEATFC